MLIKATDVIVLANLGNVSDRCHRLPSLTLERERLAGALGSRSFSEDVRPGYSASYSGSFDRHQGKLRN